MGLRRQEVSDMSKDDWLAFYLVMRLAREVAQHGRKALLPFAEAIVSESAASPVPPRSEALSDEEFQARGS